MELTVLDEKRLDIELIRLNKTLNELVRMGMVEAKFFPEENGIGPFTRYRPISPTLGRTLKDAWEKESARVPA